MTQENEILKELHEISPKLADIKKNEIFNVPENYFSDLKSNILRKIDNKRKEKKFSFSGILVSPQILVAVVIITFILFTIVTLNKHSSRENISEEYILTNFDTETIVSYIMNDPVSDRYDKNAIMDEILNENIDESLIIEEL